MFSKERDWLYFIWVMLITLIVLYGMVAVARAWVPDENGDRAVIPTATATPTQVPVFATPTGAPVQLQSYPEPGYPGPGYPGPTVDPYPGSPGGGDDPDPTNTPDYSGQPTPTPPPPPTVRPTRTPPPPPGG